MFRNRDQIIQWSSVGLRRRRQDFNETSCKYFSSWDDSITTLRDRDETKPNTSKVVPTSNLETETTTDEIQAYFFKPIIPAKMFKTKRAGSHSAATPRRQRRYRAEFSRVPYARCSPLGDMKNCKGGVVGRGGGVAEEHVEAYERAARESCALVGRLTPTPFSLNIRGWWRMRRVPVARRFSRKEKEISRLNQQEKKQEYEGSRISVHLVPPPRSGVPSRGKLIAHAHTRVGFRIPQEGTQYHYHNTRDLYSHQWSGRNREVQYRNNAPSVRGVAKSESQRRQLEPGYLIYAMEK
ncbi:hypothetical protein B0H11DRAFT_2384099 [Mycena galericulata]|nr:hypothetical protein B0H11DRAFT_2384099 [Mycena galericulata]